MKNCKLSVCLMTTMLALGATCFAQDSATPKPDAKKSWMEDPQVMATMMAMATPGENHKILEATIGSWTYKGKYWMRPDAPPIEFSGNTTTKSLMDGRFFESENLGKMMGMDFKGLATEGYDNVKKKFVATWMDNNGTGIMMMEGTYDPATKTITYTGEEEPVPGKKIKVRQTTTYTDKDHHTLDFYEVRGAEQVKTMTIDYVRST